MASDLPFASVVSFRAAKGKCNRKRQSGKERARERERVQDSTHLFIGVTGLAARGNNNIWNIYLTPDVHRKQKHWRHQQGVGKVFKLLPTVGALLALLPPCAGHGRVLSQTHTDTQGRGGYFMVVFGAVSVLLAERGRFSVSEIIS